MPQADTQTEAPKSYISTLGAANLRDQVRRALEAAMVAGELEPGALYSAPALGERFGVSATPVREAMLELSKDGFVVAERSRGFRILEVSEHDLDDISEIRLLIEVPSTVKVAGVVEPRVLDQVSELASEITAAAADGDLIQYLDLDRRFHMELISQLGNERLTELVDRSTAPDAPLRSRSAGRIRPPRWLRAGAPRSDRSHARPRRSRHREDHYLPHQAHPGPVGRSVRALGGPEMSAQTVESRSPQAPGDLVVSAPATDREGVRRAGERARKAGSAWASLSAAERAEALMNGAASLAASAEEVAELTVREVGKPIVEARMEVQRGVRILRFHGEAALLPDGDTHPRIPPAPNGTLTMSRRRARGVAGLITPWNFPVAIPLWKAAPALAYGNAVLLKAASQGTATALRLAEVLGAYLPDDVFQVLPGGAETGQAIIEAADVVSFTGSTEVGHGVAEAAAARGIPAQCEMGGLNSSIVLGDCNLEAAAEVIAGSAMGYAGQKCTATRRVIAVGNAGEWPMRWSPPSRTLRSATPLMKQPR